MPTSSKLWGLDSISLFHIHHNVPENTHAHTWAQEHKQTPGVELLRQALPHARQATRAAGTSPSRLLVLSFLCPYYGKAKLSQESKQVICNSPQVKILHQRFWYIKKLPYWNLLPHWGIMVYSLWLVSSRYFSTIKPPLWISNAFTLPNVSSCLDTTSLTILGSICSKEISPTPSLHFYFTKALL